MQLLCNAVCWGSRYELVCGSLKFWRQILEASGGLCHCTSDNLFLSSCLSVITNLHCEVKDNVFRSSMSSTPEGGWWRRDSQLPLLLHTSVTFGERLKAGSWGHLKYVVQGSSSWTVKLLERCEAWWWAEQLLVLAWLLSMSHVGPPLSLPETKNQIWSDPCQCRDALSWEQPGRGNNFNRSAVTKAYKAASKLCWVTLKGHGNKPWIQDCS